MLQAAGGPKDVTGCRSAAAAFHRSWNGLRRSCRCQLGNLGPDHAVSSHLQLILDLTDLSIKARREILTRYL